MAVSACGGSASAREARLASGLVDGNEEEAGDLGDGAWSEDGGDVMKGVRCRPFGASESASGRGGDCRALAFKTHCRCG